MAVSERITGLEGYYERLSEVNYWWCCMDCMSGSEGHNNKVSALLVVLESKSGSERYNERVSEVYTIDGFGMYEWFRGIQ